MILKHTDQVQKNLENRQRYFAKLGISLDNLVSTELIHGNNVEVVDRSNKGQIIADSDGLVTDQKNLFLCITAGDCVPIYFYDHKKEIIGIVHAGWRGVVKNIAGSLIEKMTNEYQAKPEDIVVYIGPHLKKCHFEVKQDVKDQFEDYPNFIIVDNNRIMIDLLGIIKKQLTEAGVNESNINTSDLCTYCEEDRYFSYRRDKPSNVEGMIAYIGMR